MTQSNTLVVSLHSYRNQALAQRIVVGNPHQSVVLLQKMALTIGMVHTEHTKQLEDFDVKLNKGNTIEPIGLGGQWPGL